jgi:hypothetical protein
MEVYVHRSDDSKAAPHPEASALNKRLTYPANLHTSSVFLPKSSRKSLPGCLASTPEPPARRVVGGVNDDIDGQCRNIGANGAQRGGHAVLEARKDRCRAFVGIGGW